MMRVGEESSPTHDRHLLLTSMSRRRERLKLALVTIITVNLEQMYASIRRGGRSNLRCIVVPLSNVPWRSAP
jgi:hypothetical protein